MVVLVALVETPAVDPHAVLPHALFMLMCALSNSPCPHMMADMTGPCVAVLGPPVFLHGLIAY